MDMRGLQNFIVEIRKATSNRDDEVRRVEQELGKIRSKFKTASDLSAYDRKKYVCKLLFIFMLGYEVDFGHMEAIALLAGQSPSEKLIGYLAVSLLLHENHELLTLATHTIHSHLAKGESELEMCLALTAIANVGGHELIEASAPVVQMLAAGAWKSSTQSTLTSSPAVRSKSLLTCLKIFRKGRQLIDPAVVGPAISRLIAVRDMSQAHCALSLAIALKQDPTSAPYVDAARDQCIRALNRVIMDRDTQREFIYYAVPAPWFQIKAVRLLQLFTPPESTTDRTQIETVLLRMVRGTENVIQEAQQQKSSKGGNSSLTNRCNVMVGVLVEIVALAIQWDFSDTLVAACQETVALLLNDKRDANMRYLGLLLLSRLSFCASLSETFSEDLSKHHGLIVNSLHDPDQSIRRQALDLMYAMCDRRNAAEVLGELLSYLPAAQPAFREGLVLMIAVLAEKFCTELTWYVEVVTTIIEQAGEHCGDAVWQRLCHVVVNAPSVQKVAVDLLLRAVANSTRENDVLLKTAAFLLGEFGYQIALGTGTAPIDQLNALHTKFPFASDATKAMLLTTYLKFYNLYDNATVRDKIVKVFKACRSSFDAEIQIRAAEYLCLVTQVPDEILQAVLEALPPFELQNANAVLGQLRGRQLGAEDANIWSEKAAARDEQHLADSAVAAAARGVDQQASSSPADTSAVAATAAPAAAPVEEKPAAVAAVGSPSDAHQRHTYTDPNATAPVVPALPAAPLPAAALDDIFDIVKPKPVTDGAKPIEGVLSVDNGAAAALQRDNARRLLELTAAPQGTLHVDAVFKVRFTAEFRAADGRFSMRFENVCNQPISHFACRIANAPANLVVQMRPATDGTLGSGLGGYTEVQIACRVTGGFNQAPEIAVSAVLGTGATYASQMVLPVTAGRFVEPYKFSDEAKFRGLWDASPSHNMSSLSATFGSVLSRAIAEDIIDPLQPVEALINQRTRLHTVRSTAAKATILALGAFAYMPSDAVKYDPVLAMVEACTDRGCTVTVRCRDPTVEEAVANAFRQHAARTDLPAD